MTYYRQNKSRRSTGRFRASESQGVYALTDMQKEHR